MAVFCLPLAGGGVLCCRVMPYCHVVLCCTSCALLPRCGAARHGDWIRRMRFWIGITRGAMSVERRIQGAHAFQPKARSPDPITMPYCAVSKIEIARAVCCTLACGGGSEGGVIQRASISKKARDLIPIPLTAINMEKVEGQTGQSGKQWIGPTHHGCSAHKPKSPRSCPESSVFNPRRPTNIEVW